MPKDEEDPVKIAADAAKGEDEQGDSKGTKDPDPDEAAANAETAKILENIAKP